MAGLARPTITAMVQLKLSLKWIALTFHFFRESSERHARNVSSFRIVQT